MFKTEKIINNRKSIFSLYKSREYNDFKDSYQLILEFPEVLQQSLMDWSLKPKQIFVITKLTINSVHDKQQDFNENYFLNFVDFLIDNINKHKVDEILTSSKTHYEGASGIFGRLYSLDDLKNKNFVSNNVMKIKSEMKSFEWRNKIVVLD